MRKKIALIFAGGTGSRMNMKDTPKQFININEKPIIIYTLEHFQNNPQVDEIYVVCLESWIQFCGYLIDKYNLSKVIKIIPGGSNGLESIYNGLVAIKEKNTDDSIVLIHDGVRPIITQDLINDCINGVKKFGTAVPCVPCTETIISTKNFGKVENVPLRKESFIAQAPQGFILKDILDAHNKIRITNPSYENVIDSCTMFFLLKKDVHMVNGLDGNIKVTTQKDLYLLNALLKYLTEKGK